MDHVGAIVVAYGVPQWSVLGPILFLLYVADLLQLIKRNQLHPHAYADDTQIYGFCRPSEVDDLSYRVSNCIDEVSAWMKVNRLQLNPSKTEVLLCSSARRQHQIPTSPARIGNTSVLPVSSVRDLGVYLAADVTMKTHVIAVARSFRGTSIDPQHTAFSTTTRPSDSDLEVSGNGFGVPMPSHSHTSIPISHAIPRFLPTSFPFPSKLPLPIPVHSLFPFPKLTKYRLYIFKSTYINEI